MAEPEDDDATPPRSSRWGSLALPAGLLAAGFATASVLPLGLPAWPAASTGLIAIVVSGMSGHALARGAGAFLGLLALIVGAVQILALYGLIEAL